MFSIKRVKNKWLVILFACLLLCLFLKTEFFQRQKICTKLAKIPEKEQRYLEKFFRDLISSSSGYTLFGNKPMSINEGSAGLFNFLTQEEFLLNEALYSSIWHKYQDLFPSRHFVLHEVFHSFINPLGVSHSTIFLLHKENVFNVLEKNKEVFTTISSKHYEKEEYIYRLVIEQMQTGEYHEPLGLLLGFGKHNSKFFTDFMKLENLIRSLPLVPTKSRKEESIQRGFGSRFEAYDVYDYSQEEIEAKKELLQSMKSNWTFIDGDSEENPLNVITLPMFAVDPEHSETEELRKEYTETQRKLAAVWKSDRFLEDVLLQYCYGGQS